MYKIKGNKISLTRGDTVRVKVEITDADGNPYTPSENDIITFGVKKDTADAECLIQKDIPYDTCLLQIDPEDTKSLEFGLYYYDMQIQLSDGSICTFITKSEFNIEEEVV